MLHQPMGLYQRLPCSKKIEILHPGRTETMGVQWMCVEVVTHRCCRTRTILQKFNAGIIGDDGVGQDRSGTLLSKRALWSKVESEMKAVPPLIKRCSTEPESPPIKVIPFSVKFPLSATCMSRNATASGVACNNRRVDSFFIVTVLVIDGSRFGPSVKLLGILLGRRSRALKRIVFCECPLAFA
jgi:hypothetical protein